MKAIERAVDICKTQQALADKLGVTQALVSQWIAGTTAIHNRHYAGIEKATGGEVTPAELLADEMLRQKSLAAARRTA